MLAWLARRIAEPRFQLASLAWLGLAFAHGLAFDAPFVRLFEAEHGRLARSPERRRARRRDRPCRALHVQRGHRRTKVCSHASSRICSTRSRGCDAARTRSPARPPSTRARWRSSRCRRAGIAGHVLVAALWSVVAVGADRRRPAARRASTALGASVALVLAYDVPEIAEVERSWAFGIVALAAIAVAVASGAPLADRARAAGRRSLRRRARCSRRRRRSSSTTTCRRAAALLGARDRLRRARRRAPAPPARLRIACSGCSRSGSPSPASIELLDGTMARARLGGGRRGARRCSPGSRSGSSGLRSRFFGLALATRSSMEAQPSDLFVAQRQPGSGIPAVPARRRRPGSEIARAASTRLRAAVHLAVRRVGPVRRIARDPRAGRGRSAAQASTPSSSAATRRSAALWGLVGLGLLYAGLKRGRRELQLGGFVLFGLSLAKLFVYDLAFLSSIARAFSFLAVGGLILVAGFFYQRLAGGHTAART